MNKINIGGQEFLLINQSVKNFIKLYGASLNLSLFLSKRFEIFLFTTFESTQLNLLVNVLSEIIPLRLGFRPLYIYNLLYLEYANSYRTYRHLFNLPVNGQRT